MFLIYSDGVLIGQSALEHGDPPMGVALGEFIPAAAFAAARLEAVVSEQQEDIRILRGLSLRTSDQKLIRCTHVAVIECGESSNPIGWEVECMGFESPSYADLFPNHVKAYDAGIQDR